MSLAETISVPLPPEDYMNLVCGTQPMPQLLESFESAGRLQRERLEQAAPITPDMHLLDVGCGCGRFARYLIDTPIGSYTGFDRHPGLVQWSQENITALDDRFRFIHVDVASPYEVEDHIKGKIPAELFTFPFADDQFTVANLASVFTHMRLPETTRYLHELARVVRQGGTMIFSAFLTEGEPFEKSWNIYNRPQDLREAVAAAGWRLIPPDVQRFERAEFNWRGQNFFTATL